MSESKIVLKNVRLSFPQLFAAVRINDEGKPAFSASLLIPVDHPQIPIIQEMMALVAADKWEKKATAIYAQLAAQDKLCLHNGDLKSQYDGYAGNYFISARAYTKPLVLGRSKEILTEQDGKPYGGCYVNASIEMWAQDNKFGKRINATLRGVQFIADGDAFSAGAPATPDEFEDLGVDEDIPF